MDVKKELRRIKFFEVNPSLQSLKDNEKQALELCILAADILNNIYIKQVCGDKLEDYLKIIENSEDREDLKKFFEMNGGPWSRFHEDQSFLRGVGKKPRTVSFYPEDLTEKEFEDWLKENPLDRESFESITTVIKREKDKLIAVPYSELFRKELEKANELLSEASDILKEGPLSTYLKECSKALLTNDYRESDIAWLKTSGFHFEIVFGPIEVYEDEFKGLKSSFEAFIGLPDIEMTGYLKSFKKYIHDFDKIISKKFNYKPKGAEIPMVVFEDVFRAGEAAVGRQFVAANLPNDREIHEKYGSKKVFSKTFMKAKSDYLSSKVAEKILESEDLKKYSFNARLLFVLGHEIAHGIGPGFTEKEGKKVSIEKVLGKYHPSLEEAKADTLGLAFLKFLVKEKVLSEDIIKSIIITDIVGNFSGWRTGFKEAHSVAGLIRYNWLKYYGSIIYNSEKRTISINTEKASTIYENLSYEIMEVQKKGNIEGAKNFIEKWGKVQPEIKILMDKLEDKQL